MASVVAEAIHAEAVVSAEAMSRPKAGSKEGGLASRLRRHAHSLLAYEAEAQPFKTHVFLPK